MDHITILLVEDNLNDIQLIKEYLAEEKRVQFDCIEVQSLKAALEVLPHYDFDAVLLDLNLPDSASLDTVRTITAKLPETAVVVLTGLEDDDLALQAVRYGAQDFIVKSQLFQTILGKSIRYAIERKKVHQEKADLLDDLNQALEHIELLEGMLPLCISCRKILASDNNWYCLKDFSRQIAAENPRDLLCPDCKTTLGTPAKKEDLS